MSRSKVLKELWIADENEKGISNFLGYRKRLNHSIYTLKHEIVILKRRGKVWADDIEDTKRTANKIEELEFSIKILSMCDYNQKVI
jgi:hypothetical protein